MNKKKIKKQVQQAYGNIAKSGDSCCSSSCCGSSNSAVDISRSIGYSDNEIRAVPEGANLGLGCGNPVAAADLREGDVVLDLGSGAGFDVFIAAGKVGPTGFVIGIDMTDEMIEKSRLNAEKGDYKNVEFRLGEIEKLPVEDNSVDKIISNCVINLSPDKGKVFREAFRVLKPGGSISVSDIVLTSPLPDAIKNSPRGYTACIAGASLKDDYIGLIKTAGFHPVEVLQESIFSIKEMINDITADMLEKNSGVTGGDLQKIESSLLSLKLQAEKPA